MLLHLRICSMVSVRGGREIGITSLHIDVKLRVVYVNVTWNLLNAVYLVRKMVMYKLS